MNLHMYTSLNKSIVYVQLRISSYKSLFKIQPLVPELK